MTIPTFRKVDPDGLRMACRSWVSGVAVVTSEAGDGGPVGLAVNSFTSVSLEPPLVLFCAAHTSTTWPKIRQSGKFAVNVLAEEQAALARRFARSGGDKFAGVAFEWAPEGVPVLADCAAAVVCELHGVLPGGDHDIALGRVLALHHRTARPLAFHDGGLVAVSPPGGAGS